MSRLVFLLVHSRKINFFCLLVKRTLKPRPPPGRGGGDSRRRGLRTNTAYSYRLPISSYQPVWETYSLPQFALSHARRGDMWSPAVTQSRKKERRNLSPLFFLYISLRFFLFNIISLCVCQIRIIFTYLYIIPLVLRSFIVNFFKTAAVIERSISYARYTVRNGYAR